jgi:hypothetical protein
LITNEELLQKDGYIEEREAKLLFYQFLRNNITFSTDLITGVKLFPFQPQKERQDHSISRQNVRMI